MGRCHSTDKEPRSEGSSTVISACFEKLSPCSEEQSTVQRIELQMETRSPARLRYLRAVIF